mmetsp:Transcript_14954/g.30093  ORF Transcript_14954/g.30093 Transcript_14954/m.30093 type:complete len:250 (+) Transcript_14954:456-1205(+)
MHRRLLQLGGRSGRWLLVERRRGLGACGCDSCLKRSSPARCRVLCAYACSVERVGFRERDMRVPDELHVVSWPAGCRPCVVPGEHLHIRLLCSLQQVALVVLQPTDLPEECRLLLSARGKIRRHCYSSIVRKAWCCPRPILHFVELEWIQNRRSVQNPSKCLNAIKIVRYRIHPMQMPHPAHIQRWVVRRHVTSQHSFQIGQKLCSILLNCDLQHATRIQAPMLHMCNMHGAKQSNLLFCKRKKVDREV